MVFDEGLAERVRDVVPAHCTERKMFGGIAWMDRGNMAVGIVGDDLMLRMGDAATEALQEPHTRPMDFTGKPMRGMLFVEPEGIADDSQLRDWVERALAFTRGLPAK